MGHGNSKHAKVMAWTVSPLLAGFWMLTLAGLNKVILPWFMDMESHPAALGFGTLAILGSILTWIIFMAWLNASASNSQSDAIPLKLMASFNTITAAVNSVWWFKDTILKEDALRQWLGGSLIVLFSGALVLLGAYAAINFASGNTLHRLFFARPSS